MLPHLLKCNFEYLFFFRMNRIRNLVVKLNNQMAEGGHDSSSEIVHENEEDAIKKSTSVSKTFKDLGVIDVLCEACEQIKWYTPTKIQQEAIPLAIEGRDIIGLAETGSGKTGAFALPILQALLANPGRLFALILAPTRELAFQISEHFNALGVDIG